MQRRLLYSLAYLWLSLSAGAFPQIINPSFEDTSALIWPGWTSTTTAQGTDGYNIPIGLGTAGWSQYGSVGLNPVILYPPNEVRTINPLVVGTVHYSFADNGIVPNGTNVAYIQNGHLRQRVSGFETDKSYVLTFYYNSRQATATPDFQITLGEQEIVNIPAVLAVRGGYFGRPYHFGVSDEFTAKGGTEFELVLKHLALAGTDSSVLVDRLAFEELGNLKLLSAVRDDSNPEKVVVTFSSEIPLPYATNHTLYSIDSNTAYEAQRTQTNVVELRTDSLRWPEARVLSLGLVRDNNGLRMMRTNSSVPIVIPKPAQPLLTIASAGEEVTISWRAPSQSDFLLDMSETLLPGSWVSSTASIEGGDGIWRATFKPEKTFQFFRLVTPSP